MNVSNKQMPSVYAFDVTPSDTVDIAEPGRISCLVAGTIRVTLLKMGAGTYVDVPASGWVPIIAKRIWATGTTATGIVCHP